MQILYIDDNQDLLKIVTLMLRPVYQTHTVTSIAEAADYLKSNQQIHIIMCDCYLPTESGLDFFQQLSDQHHQAIRILVTGNTTLKYSKPAVKQGVFFRVLYKPFSIEMLLNVVEESVQRYILERKKRYILKRMNTNVV